MTTIKELPPKLHILYLHGLDSSHLSTKSQLLRTYINTHHTDIAMHSPDLNMPPQEVEQLLVAKFDELKETAPVVLMGSSLGGFFSTHMSNLIGCPALLLNPSTQPHTSLQRFFEGNIEILADDVVGKETAKGWQLTVADVKWFTTHALNSIQQPQDIKLLLKTGDEVLNYEIAEKFYRQHGVNNIEIQEGGDHRMTDFTEQLPMIMTWVMQYAQKYSE